ncbi:MAG: hypothetical protein N4A46_08200 [Schleiferiaceae bacterium]|jgi:hypothetical protein|nr:hypothetical protein [Schleiferiaceae bacterium]
MNRIYWAIALFALPFLTFSQNEEFKQRITGFVASADSAFEQKTLNLPDQNLGVINEQEHDWSSLFMLKAKEKKVNNIGNKAYAKYHFSFYTYPDVTERDYAVKFWLKEFIDGQAVRPGRNMRTYPEANPTIVVINETSIAILSYSCKWYDDDAFKDWRKTMLTWFGNPASTMIEVGCDGPLDWTKNPPDSKDRTWR